MLSMLNRKLSEKYTPILAFLVIYCIHHTLFSFCIFLGYNSSNDGRTSSVGSIANDTKKCKQSAVRSSVLSSFASCLLLAYDENQQPEQHNQSMDWWKGKPRGTLDFPLRSWGISCEISLKHPEANPLI